MPPAIESSGRSSSSMCGGKEQLLRKLYRAEKHNYQKRTFIPEDEIYQNLDIEFFREALNEISRSTDIPEIHRIYLQTESGQTYILGKLRKILSILVYIGRGDHIGFFKDHYITDEKLPLPDSTLEIVLEKDVEVIELFRGKQYLFLAPQFKTEPGKVVRLELPPEYIVPILKKELLPDGKGGFGTVHEITIYPGYDKLMPKLEGEKAHRYACKQLNTGCSRHTVAFAFGHETGVQELLQEKSESILPLLFCFTDQEEYNMIFPLADSNLASFMKENEPPTSRRDRLDSLKELSQIITAIKKIHNSDRSSAKERGERHTIAMHRDVTPKNILKKGHRFFLSDFGLAHIKQIGSASISGMPYEYGITTYKAPECVLNQLVGRRADIWSLGCVLSVYLTFLYEGPRGVEEFKKSRTTIEGDNGTPLDWFHDRKNVKSEVLTWFSNLKNRFLGDSLLSESLELIENMLNGCPKQRPKAYMVERKLQEIIIREEERIAKRKDGERPSILINKTDDDIYNNIATGVQQLFSRVGSFFSPPPSPGVVPSLDFGTHSSTSQELSESIHRSNSLNRRSHSVPPFLQLSPMETRDAIPTILPSTPTSLLSSSFKSENGFSYHRRNTSHLAGLQNLDTVFLIDDSNSMRDSWTVGREVLVCASEIAMRYDPDGVDVHFLNSSAYDRFNIKTLAHVTEAFDLVKPAGENAMFMKVEAIICLYVKRLRQLSRQETSSFESRNKSHLNLIIITNGDYEIKSLADTLVHYAKVLDELGVPRYAIGLQFVLIGSTEATQRCFQALDDTVWEEENVRDIVDVTIYEPSAVRNDSIMTKILTGGFNKSVDDT